MTLRAGDVYADAEGYLWLVEKSTPLISLCRGKHHAPRYFVAETPVRTFAFLKSTGECFVMPEYRLIKRIGKL